MVVPATIKKLLVGMTQTHPDRLSRAEVEGRSSDCAAFTGRDQRCIHRREGIGRDGELVAIDIAGAFAGEVEVWLVRLTMVGWSVDAV
jgi:hypothetical protein